MSAAETSSSRARPATSTTSGRGCSRRKYRQRANSAGPRAENRFSSVFHDGRATGIPRGSTQLDADAGDAERYCPGGRSGRRSTSGSSRRSPDTCQAATSPMPQLPPHRGPLGEAYIRVCTRRRRARATGRRRAAGASLSASSTELLPEPGGPVSTSANRLSCQLRSRAARVRAASTHSFAGTPRRPSGVEYRRHFRP